MTSVIAPQVVYDGLGLPDGYDIIDVRADADLSSTPRLIPGARRGAVGQLPEWARALSRRKRVVVYGNDGSDNPGNENSRAVVAALMGLGFPAAILAGGIQAWIDSGNVTTRHRPEFNAPGGSRWVTRERPKIDRLACPWLVRRFIDPDASFFYVPAHRVRAEADALDAQPYDIADVVFSHRGPRCSFDAFIDEFGLRDPVLENLAAIVRATDTGELDQAREAPGLTAISLGLSANFDDDLVLLEHAMPIYDALYAWCKKARSETHAWPKQVSQ